MPRRHSKTSGQTVLARVREQKAMALRMGGSTYDDIGRVLGVSRAAAHKAVTRAMAEIACEAKEDAATLRDLEARRLDELQLAVWRRALAGEAAAIEAALRIMARRARMLGLDAPANHRHSGPDGGAIPIASLALDPDKLKSLTDQELDILERVCRNLAGNGPSGGTGGDSTPRG